MAANIGVDSGELRHRVTVQINTEVQDEYNQPQPGWADLVTRWAKIETVAGGDFIQSQAVRNASSHVVTMRYLAGLAPKLHQIIYEGRTFNIVSVVVPDERKIATVAYVKEVI